MSHTPVKNTPTQTDLKLNLLKPILLLVHKHHVTKETEIQASVGEAREAESQAE